MSVAAALRARLLAGKSAAPAPPVKSTVVMAQVNERGEAVLAPKAAARAGSDSLYGLAQVWTKRLLVFCLAFDSRLFSRKSEA